MRTLLGSYLLFFGAFTSVAQNTRGPLPDDLLKRAQSGDAAAQVELGRAYEDGQGVPQDDGLAVAWFRKAADQGNATAENSLGVMYSQGRGVPRDKEEAVRWYRRAAKQGLPEGLYNVAISYFNGEGAGEDLALALRMDGAGPPPRRSSGRGRPQAHNRGDAWPPRRG